MLLDTWNQLFIWVGANANKIEKEITAVAAVNKINFNSISHLLLNEYYKSMKNQCFSTNTFKLTLLAATLTPIL